MFVSWKIDVFKFAGQTKSDLKWPTAPPLIMVAPKVAINISFLFSLVDSIRNAIAIYGDNAVEIDSA